MAEGCVRGKGMSPVSIPRLQLLSVSGYRTRPLLVPRLSPSGPLSSEASASLSQQRPQQHFPLTCKEQQVLLSPCLVFCAVPCILGPFPRRLPSSAVALLPQRINRANEGCGRGCADARAMRPQ